MIADLGRHLVEAAAVGDLQAARVANEAIGKLLGRDAVGGEGASVIDLAEKREEG